MELRDLKDEVATAKQLRQLLLEENRELKAHIVHLEKLVEAMSSTVGGTVWYLVVRIYPGQVPASQVSRRSQPISERLLKM